MLFDSVSFRKFPSCFLRLLHHLRVSVIWRCISAGTSTFMSVYCCFETSTVFSPSGCSCLCHWSLSGRSGSHGPVHWGVYCTLSLIGLRLMYFHNFLAVGIRPAPFAIRSVITACFLSFSTANALEGYLSAPQHAAPGSVVRRRCSTLRSATRPC